MSNVASGRDDLAADPAARERLATYLRHHVPEVRSAGPLVAASRLSGGFSNETWLLSFGSDRASSLRLVLRRPPLSGVLEPYDIGREAAVLDALGPTPVPVPRVYHYCDGLDFDGHDFMVMEFVDGQVPDYRDLPTRSGWASDKDRLAMGCGFLRTLAAVQEVDWRAADLGRVLGEPSGPSVLEGTTAALIRRMSEKVGDTWKLPPMLTDAAAWLRANAPATDPNDLVLVHGDYKVGNLMWRDGRVVALLDWELSGIGDPLQDLGYACHPIMRTRDPSLMAMLLTTEELIAVYERETGRTVDPARLHYHMIYAVFFHAYTAVMGLHAVAFESAGFQASSMYLKLSQATVHLVQEIENYESGRHAV